MTLANPFNNPIFQILVPAQNGIGLVPAAGYKAKFYEAGTTNPQEIYTDPDLTTPYPSPSNVAVMDLNGQASQNGLIYLKTAGYKMVITDPNDTPIENGTVDNIAGNGAAGSFNCGFVDNFAALTTLNASIFAYAFIAGYSEAGDGGQGMFYLQTSGASANGGYIQNSTDGTKKWFRVPDEDGDVRAASFGYIGDVGTIQTTQLQSADSYAASIGARLRIGAGSDAVLTTTMHFTAPYVTLNPNGEFKGSALNPVAISFDGIFEGPAQRIFGSNILSVAFSSFQVSDTPQWFGASVDNDAATNKPFLDSWIGAGGGKFTLPPGTWKYPTPKTFLDALPQVIFEAQGKIEDDAVAYTFGPGFWLPKSIRAQKFLFSNSAYFTNDGGNGIQAYGSISTDQDINADGTILGAGVTAGISGMYSGADIQAVGNALIGGTAFSTDVESFTNIVAGTGGAGGYLKAQAGTGSATFKAGGFIAGGVQNTDVTAGTLSLTVPANTLVNVGDCVVVEAGGTATATAGDIGLKLTSSTSGDAFDATLHVSSGSNAWTLRAVIIRSAANTISCDGAFICDGTPSSFGNTQASGKAGVVFTTGTDQTIVLSTTVGGSGALTAKRYTLEYKPAHP